MTQSTYDESGDARRALQFVYANYGAAAIDDPKMLNTLLPDLLPGEPLEAHLLLAAAGGGVGRLLRDRIASMPAEAAVRDVAAMLVARNALDPRACRWVVAEYATAMGHPVTVSPDPQGAPPPPIGDEGATRRDTSPSPPAAGAPFGMVAPVFAPRPMTPQDYPTPRTPPVYPPPVSPTTPYPLPQLFPPPQYMPLPPKKSNAPLVAGIVIGIVVVVGGAVGAAVAYSGQRGHTTPPSTKPAALTSLLPSDLTFADDCTSNSTGDAPGMFGIVSGYECDEPDGSPISGGHIEAYQFQSQTALKGSLSAVNLHVAFNQSGSDVHDTCPPDDGQDGYLRWKADGQERGTLECYHTDDGECAYIWTDDKNFALFYADTAGQDCSDMEDWWKNESGAD
jgi:hypothetical protein